MTDNELTYEQAQAQYAYAKDRGDYEEVARLDADPRVQRALGRKVPEPELADVPPAVVDRFLEAFDAADNERVTRKPEHPGAFTVTTTGLEAAALVPVGSTLVKAAWHVPDYYGPGDEFPTRRDALAAAIERKAEVAASVGYEADWVVTIDLRWSFDYPKGHGGITTVAQRITYPTLDDARRGLQMIDYVEANR